MIATVRRPSVRIRGTRNRACAAVFAANRCQLLWRQDRPGPARLGLTKKGRTALLWRLFCQSLDALRDVRYVQRRERERQRAKAWAARCPDFVQRRREYLRRARERTPNEKYDDLLAARTAMRQGRPHYEIIERRERLREERKRKREERERAREEAERKAALEALLPVEPTAEVLRGRPVLPYVPIGTLIAAAIYSPVERARYRACASLWQRNRAWRFA